mmetsp:Transcript_32661/g.47934  ORF Transcript_32661/g.47934 Transcript_32661/m.47934 type:complete len:313 (+) Transcript_32661:1949-2887(+)
MLLVQALDGGLGNVDAVGTERLLELLGRDFCLDERLGLLTDVDFGLCLELFGHHVRDAQVHVVAADVALVRTTLDLNALLGEPDDGRAEVGVSHVDEHDVRRLLGVFVKLTATEDAVREGRGGRLVDELQEAHVGDGGSVAHGAALSVCEECRHSDHHFHVLLARVGLGERHNVSELHGEDLRRGEDVRLASVSDLDADLVVFALDDLVVHIFDLVLDVWVTELAPDEALDAGHGVLVLRARKRGCELANMALALVEGHERRREPARALVQDDGDATALGAGSCGIGDGEASRAEINADNGHGGGVLAATVK